jgi:hypothetical protein
MSKKSLSVKDMNSQKIVNLGAGTADTTDAATTAQVKTAQDFAASLNNATGTLSPVTTFIPTFDTQVRTSKLNQMSAPDGSVAFGSQKITGLADPTNPQEGATKAYVDAATAALSGGLAFKGAVRAATTSNVNIASAPATIDSVTLSNGEVALLTGQTTGSQNGPYVYNGVGVAMTRPANWDTTGEAVPGSMWVVQQGTFDNQLAILSNNTFTLNTTTGTFVFLNPASAADNDTGYAEDCPATTGGLAWPVNHGLGTKDVTVAVFRVASPYDEVEVNFTRDTTNQVNIRPDITISAGEFRAVVSKVV